MTRHQCEKIWAAHYGEWSPIAHRMRATRGMFWVRFHALPNSKRYPSTPREYSVVLSRHNTLLSELYDGGEPLLLLTASYSNTKKPVDRAPVLKAVDPTARYWKTAPMYVEEDPKLSSYYHTYFSERAWEKHAFDELLRAVADDDVADVCMLKTDIAIAYHPYDGGCDIVTEVERLRDELARGHRAWLPRNIANATSPMRW